MVIFQISKILYIFIILLFGDLFFSNLEFRFRRNIIHNEFRLCRILGTHITTNFHNFFSEFYSILSERYSKYFSQKDIRNIIGIIFSIEYKYIHLLNGVELSILSERYEM